MIGILIAENPVHDSDCKAALSINHSVAMTVTNPMAELVGPGFIGFVFCLSLYGVTMAQTTLYYRRFPGDAKKFKFLVWFLFIIDTFHISLLCKLFWFLTITGEC